MFITSLIKRKLKSALQPWLLQEPELELKLGFLRSHVIAKNLRFNVSALNQLLDDSTSFYFTDFTIEQLTIRICNWSAPAFNWEVQGFHVTVSPRLVAICINLLSVCVCSHFYLCSLNLLLLYLLLVW